MAIEKLKSAVLDIFKKESYMDGEQLKRLAQHRYKADDQSIMTKVIFCHFWDWFTKFYPLWLAPNVITFVGLIINSAATLILAWYTPDCAQLAPKWAFLQCALALFTYQTLDSTDGKQARRTHTSSPLGELFDHGCDSLTQTFLALQVSMALSLGDTRWGVLQFWLVAIYMFYAAHWQTYSTGVLIFGKFDIVETQCVIMAVLIMSGVFGPEFWFAEILGISLRRWFLTPCAIIAVFVSSTVLYNIFTKGAGNGRRTVADTSVAMPVIPIIMVLLLPALVYWKSTSGVYDRHIFLFCLAFGTVATKVTSRIILAHMSRSPTGILDTSLIGPLVIAVNQYFGNPLSEYYILCAALVYGFTNLTYYAYSVCRQICDHMKIDTFRIPYPPPKITANGAVNGDSHH